MRARSLSLSDARALSLSLMRALSLSLMRACSLSLMRALSLSNACSLSLMRALSLVHACRPQVDEARACGWDLVAALAPDTRRGVSNQMVVPLEELRVVGPVGLVLGNEGAGIR